MKAKLIASLLAAFILSVVSGCQESNKSSQTESQMVRQLKIEKAQLVQEFQGKEAALNKEIADLKSEITKKNLIIKKNENKEKGMAEVVSRIMEQMKNQQKKIDTLEAHISKNNQAQATTLPAKIEAEPQSKQKDDSAKGNDISIRLEKLKQLQKKAATQENGK